MTLGALDAQARATLGRLRDCGRAIEQMTAAVHAVRHGPERDRIEQRLRALAIEAPGLRVELRTWHIAAPDWFDHVDAQVDALAAGIQALLHRASVATTSARSRDHAFEIGRAA